jgi:hypothetical protein
MMSAKAGTSVEDGPFTSIMFALARSTNSALLMPSFFASSLTLIFAVATQSQSFTVVTFIFRYSDTG